MSNLTVSVLTGLAIGIADIIPMIIKKLPRYSTASAFLHYFFTSIVIFHLEIPGLPWWLKGAVVGLALMLPMIIHVGHSDRKPIPVITINAVILGTIAGVASHYLSA